MRCIISFWIFMIFNENIKKIYQQVIFDDEI